MDGDRIDSASFVQRFSEKKVGSTVALTVMRRDQLMTVNVVVTTKENLTYSIKERPDASEAQKTVFTSWLAEKSLAAQGN
jgi:predicted metalloprotease with PDZ domain